MFCELPDDLGRVDDLFGQTVTLAVQHPGILRDHRVGDDELADHVDQPVQPLRAHPHRGFNDLAAAAHLILGAQRLSHVGDTRRLRLDQGDAQLLIGVLAQGLLDLAPIDLALRDQDVADARGRGLLFLRDAGRFRVFQHRQELVVPRGLEQGLATQGTFHGLHHGLDHVQPLQRQVCVAAAVADLPIAHAAEQGLGVMPELRNQAEFEKGRGALDGVKGAEDLAHGFHIPGVMLEGQQRLFRILDEIGALVDEFGHEVHVEVFGHVIGDGILGRRAGHGLGGGFLCHPFLRRFRVLLRRDSLIQ